jgi:cyclopropane-fatty-acyl-phospholipid synthase
MADLTQTALQPELPASAGTLGVRGHLSRRVLKRWTKSLNSGTLDVIWSDGTAWRKKGSQPGSAAQINVNNPRFVRRVALGGALGLADSYVDGDWDTPDLTAVFALGIENEAALANTLTQSLPRAVLGRLRHRLQANTIAGSRRNIAAHYDLGNDFYAAWLDETMTYSSGLFADPLTSLAEAQDAKFARIAEVAGLQDGDRVLEIGCGWGGFAIYAARHFDCHVTALTVSQAQAQWARRTVAEAGLADKVEIRLQDYRDVDGTFDRIVSIEMFEAVGEAYWPAFFATVRDRLKPGGSAGVQVITIDDDRFARYRQQPDFIQLRVFPGGMLPSPKVFSAAANAAGIAASRAFTFGPSYAETVRHWRNRFEAGWPDLERLGFDEPFRRLWRYYLCYCEAGFDAGTISVAHYRLGPPN